MGNTEKCHSLRLALKDLGCPYVHEISFLDKSKRRAECFVNEADVEKFVAVMRKAKMLDEEFNIMVPPPHKPEITTEMMQKQVVERRAHIMASTHFGPLKRAAADILSTELSQAVTKRAIEIRNNQGIPPGDRAKTHSKTPRSYYFINNDRLVALAYARENNGTLYDLDGCLTKKYENGLTLKLGPTHILKRYLELDVLNRIQVTSNSTQG